MKATIGYYDDGMHRAGTGRYLTEIIGALDRTRYTPVFFAPIARTWHEDLRALDVEMVYRENAEAPGVPAESVGDRQAPPGTAGLADRLRLPYGVAWSAGLLKEIVQTARLLQQRRVDLLHSNNTGAEPAPIAARLAQIPRILGTFHVLPSYDLDGTRSGWNFRLLEKASMRSLHHAIACCEAAKRDWEARCGLSPRLTTVIHNGIDLNRVARRQTIAEARAQLDLPENAFIFGAVGNLHPYKGYEFLLRALPTLLATHPDSLALIAGTGPLEASLRELAQTLNVSHAVRFLGFCSDVRSVLEALDAYVQASLVEAFPIAILEASGLGLPIVATAVGGVPEAIADGRTGLLTPPRNPEALAEALASLADDPERRALFSEAGQCRVRQHFTREKMLDAHLAIYERMLQQRP